MRAPRLTPATYRKLTLGALVSLVAIVITGALVRLTDSGLGCADWPQCSDEKFIDVTSSHAAIEQINRLFTGLVGVAVIVAVAGSLLRSPRRRDLTWLSLSLVVGVIGQAIVGGVVVLSDLHPIAVQQHFLLSMALLAAALTLYRRAGMPDGTRWQRGVSVRSMNAVWTVSGFFALALITGTLVTGTGPHSGQHEGEPVQRFGWAISSVARVHSVVVLCAIAAALWLFWRVRNTEDFARLEHQLETLLLLGFVQGTVGYIQYFNDVPVVLVALHVGLATLLWLTVVDLLIATRASSAPLGGEAPADLVELGDGLLDDVLDRPH